MVVQSKPSDYDKNAFTRELWGSNGYEEGYTKDFGLSDEEDAQLRNWFNLTFYYMYDQGEVIFKRASKNSYNINDISESDEKQILKAAGKLIGMVDQIREKLRGTEEEFPLDDVYTDENVGPFWLGRACGGIDARATGYCQKGGLDADYFLEHWERTRNRISDKKKVFYDTVIMEPFSTGLSENPSIPPENSTRWNP